MKTNSATILDVIFETPGPRTKKRIKIITTLSVIFLIVLVILAIRRFYFTGQLDARYWSFFARYTTWRFLGYGLLATLSIAVVAGIITFAMGFLFMIGRISQNKIAQWISIALIEISRGTPTLLFIYFFFLVAPQLGLKLHAFWKIVFPVAISASGIVAEMLRSGVNAVSKEQTEAALSLGMKKSHIFLKIVFPQGFRFVIPSLISEIVIVLKDSTFAYVVNYGDLMQNARVLVSNYDALLSVHLVVAAIYILINFALGKIAQSVGVKKF